jgi:phosphotransferase system HPr-like phosphotransfer protein
MEITIRAEGEDEVPAVEALVALVKNNFGEE